MLEEKIKDKTNVRYREEVIIWQKYAENVSTTSEIFQSHRTAVMQSFVVEMRTATITEYRLCMTIVVRILRKRSSK